MKLGARIQLEKVSRQLGEYASAMNKTAEQTVANVSVLYTRNAIRFCPPFMGGNFSSKAREQKASWNNLINRRHRQRKGLHESKRGRPRTDFYIANKDVSKYRKFADEHQGELAANILGAATRAQETSARLGAKYHYNASGTLSYRGIPRIVKRHTNKNNASSFRLTKVGTRTLGRVRISFPQKYARAFDTFVKKHAFETTLTNVSKATEHALKRMMAAGRKAARAVVRKG